MAPDAPPVTVVVPTRDRPALLREAIHAISAQNYAGVITTLVVYDGTDCDRALEGGTASRPVRVLENVRRPGLAGARNTGVLATRDELVAFCDDDDTWLTEKLQPQVELLTSRPDSNMCGTGILVDFEGRCSPRLVGSDTVVHDQLLKSRMAMLHSSTFLFRRRELEHIGLVDERIPGGQNEDWDLLLRASALAPVAVVDRALVRVRWGRASYYARRWDAKVEALQWMLRYHPDLADHRVGAARVHGQIAYAHACAGRSREARRWAARAVRLHPLEWRAAAAATVSTGLVDGDRFLEILHRFGRGV